MYAEGVYHRVMGHSRVSVSDDSADQLGGLGPVAVCAAEQFCVTGPSRYHWDCYSPRQNKEDGFVEIDETRLNKGQVRKLNALRKSVGTALGEEVFGKWLALQAKATAQPRPDAVAIKIGEALDGFADDRTFRLGNYGYTIRRARGKGVSGFVVTKNQKPRP